MNTNVTDRFIDLLYGIKEAGIPEKVTVQAKKCLIDYLGVCFAGTYMMKDKVDKLLDRLDSGADASAVIGMNRKAGIETAALANGINSHVIELDDGSRFGAIHPGSPIFSALLPVAEKENIGLKDLLSGVIVGYEAAIRLSTAILPSHYDRGYHPTSTCGSVGAAIGIAVMLGFDKQQMKDALSAAAISASGTLKVIEKGSELKPFNAGRAAALAVMSSYMALGGFQSPADALGGKNGFLSMVTNEYDLKELTGKRNDFCIENIYFKPYAACRHAHPSIEAILDIKAKQDLDMGQIDSIHVRTYERVIGNHDHSDVNDISSAKMSIPYAIAVSYLTGKAGILEFSEELIRDPRIKDLLKKISIEGDPKLSALMPQKRSAILKLRTNDGSIHEKRVDYPKGEPENPMSMDDIEKKFVDLSDYAGIPGKQSREILDIVWEEGRDLHELYKRL